MVLCHGSVVLYGYDLLKVDFSPLRLRLFHIFLHLLSFSLIAVAYDIGFIMIAIRFVASVAGNLVSLFQLDAPQMPGPLSRFDPLHNAYLGTVLLEAQLQLESMDESQ